MKKIKSIFQLLKELYSNRQLIITLSKNDFKTKFSGSYLGITWAFVQPVITVVLFWFVFEVGFKSGPVNNKPFILWLISGLIPWFFYSEAVSNSTFSLLEYSYLVKKVVFKISILPVVKVTSSLFVHIFFIVFVMYMFFVYGYSVDFYLIQVLYYSGCMYLLVLATGFITASIIPFFRDLGNLISIYLTITMWITPITWNYEVLPEKYRFLIKMNPMYYIVEGYRDTFIHKVWFFERYNQTIYFWALIIVFFALGTFLFKKLKPHFSDVL